MDLSANLIQAGVSTNKQSNCNKQKCIKYLTFFSYCLITVCCGSLEPLGGALYTHFETQLNTTPQTIANILSIKPIASGVAAILSAWIFDHVVNAHYYIALICIIVAITIALVPHMNNVWQMYVAFVPIGYFIGLTMVTYPVYTLRLYRRSNRALFRLLSVYGISKTLSPILIQSAIDQFDSYAPFLYMVSGLLLILSVLLCCLRTPKAEAVVTQSRILGFHTESPALRSKIITTKLKCVHKMLYTSLILMYFCFGAFQSGLVNFIQKYMINIGDNLHKDQQTARYLISSYYLGQLLYRILAAILCKRLSPRKSMLVTNSILIIFGLLFIGFGHVSFLKDSYIWMIYGIYVNLGFWASGINPCTVKWAEKIKPLTGFITGLIIIASMIGDASMVMLNGQLIKIFGAYIVPFPIFVYIVNTLLLTIIAYGVDSRLKTLSNFTMQSKSQIFPK
eukprot:22362_1